MKKSKFIFTLMCTLAMAAFVACSDDNPNEPNLPGGDDNGDDNDKNEWVAVEEAPDTWDQKKRADMTYQLLVYSFADGPDAGSYGDLQGLTSKLDYINSLGVNAIWLSPIHPSPSYHGYDVEDYHTVSSKLGTEGDFRQLIEEAHKRDIKVYLDFVLNHTSKTHPYFADAKSNVNSPYRDYFIFSKDPQKDITDGKIAMIASEGAGGYNEGEWKPAISSAEEGSVCYKFVLDWSNASAPTVTVTEGNPDDVKTNEAPDTDTDRYLYFGDPAVCLKFFPVSGSTTLFELTVNFASSWGFLIRTSATEWGDKKWGTQSSGTKAELGKALTLTNGERAADILLGNMDVWKYHCAFDESMPDINYGPAATCETSAPFLALVDAAKGWIDRGVDGLRLDAVKHIYHKVGGNENPTFLKKFYDELNSYYKQQGNSRDFYMVGEVLSGAGEVAPYYQGLPALFEFDFWNRLEWAINNSTGCYFCKDILGYQNLYKNYRSDYIEATKLSNHDEDRTGGTLGKSLAKEKLAAAVLLTSAGSPYIYYGEELGYYNLKKNGDQNVREPMQWGEGSDADFGENCSKSEVKSVKEQLADDSSLLRTYQKFATLRNTYPALAQGTMSRHTTYNESNTAGDAKKLAAWYMTQGDQKILVMHNFGSDEATLNLAAERIDKVLATNGTVTQFKAGDYSQVKLGAYSTLVVMLAE